MEILIASAICLGIAAVCAILLTTASILFGIKEDETFLKIRDSLPGANCGACGYSGCDGYAKALSEGKTKECNLCIPGGKAAAEDISAVLGLEAGETVRTVAYVSCKGTCDAVERKFDYRGSTSCKSAKLAYAGDKACAYACLGYGDCAAVCPENAIDIHNGTARILSEHCLGCGKCAKTCPSSVIQMIPASARAIVSCSNHDKGAVTRKLCKNGCIGCGKCVKTCQSGAISLVNNLALIDQSKCTACGACIAACPVHAIHEDCFLCDKKASE